jgi:formylmethanofuran dehydrogenase subunit D
MMIAAQRKNCEIRNIICIPFHPNTLSKSGHLESTDMALGDFLFPNAELKLVIIRSFKTDIESARGIPSQKYTSETAIVRLNNSDMRRLSIKEGNTISLKSPSGTVVVKAVIDEKTPEGSAIMPYGPWALALVAIPEDSTPPVLHGIAITATRSKEDITSVEALLVP